jgi:hypothetical protein
MGGRPSLAARRSWQEVGHGGHGSSPRAVPRHVGSLSRIHVGLDKVDALEDVSEVEPRVGAPHRILTSRTP